MEKIIEYRREFHKYPEYGWHEFRTSARVAEILTDLGYDVIMGSDVVNVDSIGEPERLTNEQTELAMITEFRRLCAQNGDHVERVVGEAVENYIEKCKHQN